VERYQYGCNNPKGGFQNSIRNACIALQESNKILEPFKYSRIPPFHHEQGDNFWFFATCTRNWLLQTTSEDFSFGRLVSWRGNQYGCNNQKNGFQNSIRSARIACKNQISSRNHSNIPESHHFTASKEIISYLSLCARGIDYCRLRVKIFHLGDWFREEDLNMVAIIKRIGSKILSEVLVSLARTK